MRVRSVEYFMSHINDKNFRGVRNQEEITNEEIAEYFCEKNKKSLKIAA